MRYFPKLQLAIIISIAVLVPAVILPQAFNYVLVKLAIAQFFLIILLLFWIYHTFESGEITIQKDPAYLPLVCLLGWYLINLFFSSFRYASIEEIGKMLTYVFLYFAVVNAIERGKNLALTITFILITCFVLIFHALFKHLHDKVNVIISTFGNPNFFSAYLILLLPLFILMGIYNLRQKNFFVSSLTLITAIITILLVYILNSQGAFLGIGVCLVFLIILFRKQIFKPKMRFKILAVFLALLLASTALSIQKMPQIKKYLKEEAKTGTVGIRLKIWQGTWRMIKERPLTGWGAGTFYIVYPNFRVPEYFLNPHSVNATRHAHNELLEVTAEAGIIGVGFFLWLLIVVFSRGIKSFNRQPLDLTNFINAGLMAGMMALLIQNLTGVNLRFEASGLYLYLFLGLISATCSISQNHKEENIFRKKIGTKKALPWLIIPIAILLGIVYTKTTLSMVRSSIHLKKGIILRNNERWEDAIEHYHKSIEWNEHNLRSHYRLAYAYAETKQTDKALAAYMQLKELAPDYAQVHYNLGALYLKLGKWQEAKKELQRAIELDPYDPRVHCNMAIVHLQLGETDNAIAEFNNAILVQEKKKELNPKLPDFAGGYRGLGDIYYSKQDWRKAAQNYEAAVKLGDKNATILKKLGNCHLHMQNLKTAKNLYEKVLEMDSSQTELKEVIQKLDKFMETHKNNAK